MTDDTSDIVRMYNSAAGGDSQRLEKHRLEFDLTMRFLDKYLPGNGRILEIGAADGKYTLELAKKGHHLCCVDFAEAQISGNKKKITEAGFGNQVEYLVADARDLKELKDKTFDVVLLMGPLYHLIYKKDRELAVREAFRCLRKGGMIFSSFISRYGILGDLMKNIPDWIERQKDVRAVIEDGHDSLELPRHGFRGYFTNVSEIEPLHKEAGFQAILIAGVEPAISEDDGSYNKLEGERKQAWQDLLFEISTEKSIVGASRHLLYIGKK